MIKCYENENCFVRFADETVMFVGKTSDKFTSIVYSLGHKAEDRVTCSVSTVNTTELFFITMEEFLNNLKGLSSASYNYDLSYEIDLFFLQEGKC